MNQLCSGRMKGGPFVTGDTGHSSSSSVTRDQFVAEIFALRFISNWLLLRSRKSFTNACMPRVEFVSCLYFKSNSDHMPLVIQRTRLTTVHV